MRPDWTIIGVILTALAVVVAYLQLVRTPKPVKTKPIEKADAVSLLKLVNERKSITIGCFNYPPFVDFPVETDEPSGYYPTIFKEIAKKHDLNINWKYVSICDAVDAVLSKEVDIIISIFQTPKRAKFVDFCCLFHSVKIGGVAKQELKGITSLSDLVTSRLKIVVGKNEIGHELTTIYEIPKNRLVIIENEEVSKIISFVEIGQADIAILDSVSIKNFFEKYLLSKASTLKPIFQTRPLYMCLDGIMILQDQHDFTKWLEREVNQQRNTKPIQEIENAFLTEYDNIIFRL